MKNWFPALISICIATGVVYFISTNSYTKAERTESLYAQDSFDDPDNANTDMYMRLRNPLTGELPKDMRKRELAFAATLPQQNDNSRSTQWQNRGPYNLGGRTRALALDVTNENIILAGQATGGMWRSTDAGASFTKTTQPGQLHSVTCVAQDKRAGKTNVWYYGTGEQYGVVNAAGFSSQFSGDGIFKSTDNGLTWAQLPSTVSNTPTTLYQKRDFDFVWQIVTDPTNTTQDEVYAATVNGIWRSTDGGGNWTPVLGLDTAANGISQYVSLAITTTGVLYATISSETASKGIWRSEDGINWTAITPAGFASSYRRVEIGIAPSDETQVYFIADASGSGTTGHELWHYKYLSGDGSGANGQWDDRTANIPDDHCLGFYTFDFRKYNSQTSYDMYIAVHPSDANILFLGGTNIYRSYDGFTTDAYSWIGGYQCDSSQLSNYVYPNHHPDQHKLIFLPSDNTKALSANDGGLMKTENIMAPTVNWQLMNNWYNTGQFYTCAIEPGNTDNDVIVGGLQDNGTFFTNTTDYNRPWDKVCIGDGAYCAITHGRNNYYLSWQSGKVFKMSIDANGTATGLERIDPTGGTGYQFIDPFILDPIDDNVMYLCAGKLIWRNDSLGAIAVTGNEYNTTAQGWKKLNQTNTGIGPSALYSSLDISEANTNILYLGTSVGTVFRVDSCRTNNSAARVNITSSNFPSGAYVSCIETDRLNANNVMVTFSNYGVQSIFYSSDAGATWDNVSGNLEENTDGSGNGPSVTWANIYNDGTTTTYYVGTSIGLFSTTQLNGTNTVWTQEGPNTIGNVIINMITSRPFDHNIVVATHGNGMYSNKIFTPSGIGNINSAQVSVNCFPNPFTASVSFDVSELNGKTNVDIYALNGTLEKRMAATSNHVIWDGNNESGTVCAPGTYLANIQCNGKAIVKKIVKL